MTSARAPLLPRTVGAPPLTTWRVPVFLMWGAIGFAAGSAAGFALAAATGRSMAATAAMAGASVAAFLALAITTKAVKGNETLTFYHHALAVLAACTVVLLAAGKPLLPYLDLAVLGLLTFLVFGRLGCHSVGCCYGQPHEWGASYWSLTSAEGVPAHLLGVTLLPVQLFEAGASAVIVLLGSVAVLRGWSPGTALVWCACAYATARFVIELGRGDEGRRYWRGASVPQWTSVALACGCSVLAVLGLLPDWGMAVGFSCALAVGVLAIRARRRTSIARHDLFGPRHTHDLCHVLDASRTTPLPAGGPEVWQTGHGLLLSTSTLVEDGRKVRSYTISHAAHSIDERMAARMARRIVLLRHRGCDWSILPGCYPGVYHILVLETTGNDFGPPRPSRCLGRRTQAQET